jgi:glycosyltransferase involved in cell wall biosynthesis
MTFPSLKDKGGVVSFCKLLTQNLTSSFNIDHLTIGNRPWNKSFIKQYYYFLHDSLYLKRKLRMNTYGLVQLNPSLYIYALLRDAFYLSTVNKFHRGKTVVMFHGWNKELAEKIINSFLLRKLFQKIYGKAHLILVLCSKFKEQLVIMGIHPEKVRVITTMYEGSQSMAQIQEGKATEKIKILFMSRLIKSKGVDIVAEVGRLLVEKGHRNFKLLIAGDGPELEGIKKYIKQNALDDYVETLGYISGEKKGEVLKESDIFLFPSHSEGCPVAVLEAIGAGLAVVSTPVGAIPEIIQNEVNGYIIRGQNPQEFFEAVKKLIEDRELLKKMQRLNKEKAEEHYEAKVVTKKIELLYLSLMREKEGSTTPAQG